MNDISSSKEFYEVLVKNIHSEVKKMGLLTGNIRYGEVHEVISANKLTVFVDGSPISQEMKCNPDVMFLTGDRVWVHMINGDSKNKFVFSRIGGNTLRDSKSGASLNRPSKAPIGYMYFDTTLSKPIWYTGSKWVNSEGTAV